MVVHTVAYLDSWANRRWCMGPRRRPPSPLGTTPLSRTLSWSTTGNPASRSGRSRARLPGSPSRCLRSHGKLRVRQPDGHEREVDGLRRQKEWWNHDDSVVFGTSSSNVSSVGSHPDEACTANTRSFIIPSINVCTATMCLHYGNIYTCTPSQWIASSFLLRHGWFQMILVWRCQSQRQRLVHYNLEGVLNRCFLCYESRWRLERHVQVNLEIYSLRS